MKYIKRLHFFFYIFCSNVIGVEKIGPWPDANATEEALAWKGLGTPTLQ